MSQIIPAFLQAGIFRCIACISDAVAFIGYNTERIIFGVYPV